MAKIKNFYATSNTSIGFYSLFDEVLQGLERIYILKGGPGTGKSTFMRKVGLILMEKDLELEYYHCAADNQSLDGIVIPELKVGIVDGTEPHLVEPKYPGVIENVINMNDFSNDEELNDFRDEIIKLTNNSKFYFNKAHKKFAEAKAYFLQREQLYSQTFSEEMVEELTEDLIGKTFNRVPVWEENPYVKRLFFGATTPKGSVNFIDNITQELMKRIILKGYSDSEKSAIMSKIGKIAEGLNYSVEYYLCPFDPKRIDMIVIPGLSMCIVDGSTPHIVDPFRAGDEVINFNDDCLCRKVENEHKDQLYEINITYQSLMAKGMNYLSEAKRLHDNLEKYYSNAMDFQKVNEKRQEIISEILWLHQSLNYS